MAYKVNKMEEAINLLLPDRGMAINKRAEKKKKETQERNEKTGDEKDCDRGKVAGERMETVKGRPDVHYEIRD